MAFISPAGASINRFTAFYSAGEVIAMRLERHHPRSEVSKSAALSSCTSVAEPAR